MESVKRRLRFPIRWKAITMIVALAVVIIEIAVAYYSIMMTKVNRDTYSNVAKDVAASVAKMTPVDAFKVVKEEVNGILKNSDEYVIAEESSEKENAKYLKQFEELTDETKHPTYNANFAECLKFTRVMQEANEDFVDCIYLTYLFKKGKDAYFVYLVDGALEDACPAGQLDPIYDMNKGLLEDPTIGFPPYVTNTGLYGWLITAGSPIYDGTEVVGYAMADISMYTVRKAQASSIVRMFLYMVATLIVLGTLGVVWVSLWMIRPLKNLTDLAKSYDATDPKGTHERFKQFTVKTNDEILDLTESIKLMEKDVYDRFNALVDTNRQLVSSKEETKKMTILANQDGLTGVHNKVAYNSEVERINEQIESGEDINFAVVMVDLNYLKDINDAYGHDVGDMAIIKLVSMICETFTLSPVYRVGGDEFVVICRGKDFIRISYLISVFKTKVAESSNGVETHDGEHISAAIGYSLFDKKKDKGVNDVFKRADKAMYENKREIKEGK